MKKKLFLLATVVFLIGSMCMPVFGAQKTNTVSVSLPNFKVTINGEVINNDYSKYPLIGYNNITYFPMTYSDCRFLGIESTWKGNSAGLIVEKTGVTAAYQLYKSSSKNGRNYTATIPTFPVTVNGKSIDNGKETYPLLSFRDITYFPMTWAYAANAFGWKYSFDAKNGLIIQSDNIKLTQIALTKNRPTQSEYDPYPGKLSDCVLTIGDMVYYDDTKGGIIQASLSNLSNAKNIYQLGFWSYGDGTTYDQHNFYIENGEPYLFFHSGGAVMGSDNRYKLKSDGSTQLVQENYWETTLIGNTLFYYYVGPAPDPGNLRMQELNTTEEKQIGGSGYWYYGLHSDDINGMPKLSLIGDELYVRAAQVLSSDTTSGSIQLGDQAVYKVNIKTDAVTRVSKQSAVAAQIVGNTLYYHDGKSIYKVSLTDTTEQNLGNLAGISTSEYESKFAVVGDKVYWVNTNNGALCTLGKQDSLNPGAELDSMGILGDNGEYLVCTFKETQASKYRMMVFDQTGKVVFKTSDKTFCKNVSIKGHQLSFYNITTETICRATI